MELMTHKEACTGRRKMCSFQTRKVTKNQNMYMKESKCTEIDELPSCREILVALFKLFSAVSFVALDLWLVKIVSGEIKEHFIGKFGARIKPMKFYSNQKIKNAYYFCE